MAKSEGAVIGGDKGVVKGGDGVVAGQETRRRRADFFNLQVPLVTCLGNQLAAAQMGENRRRRQK